MSWSLLSSRCSCIMDASYSLRREVTNREPSTLLGHRTVGKSRKLRRLLPGNEEIFQHSSHGKEIFANFNLKRRIRAWYDSAGSQPPILKDL